MRNDNEAQLSATMFWILLALLLWLMNLAWTAQLDAWLRLSKSRVEMKLIDAELSALESEMKLIEVRTVGLRMHAPVVRLIALARK